MYFTHMHRHDSKTKTASIKLDVNTVCRLAWWNTTRCVPRYCKSLLLSTCLSSLHWVLLLVIVHQHTYSGLQRSVVQKIYDWQINIQWLVEPSLWTWHWTKQSAVFSQGSLAYYGMPSNWVWLQRDHQCWRHSRNDNMTPHCNLDLEDSKTILHDTGS